MMALEFASLFKNTKPIASSSSIIAIVINCIAIVMVEIINSLKPTYLA